VGRVYDIKKDWYHSTGIRIKIIKAYKQRLGDITPEEAQNEGGYTISEFVYVWMKINGVWDPDEIVWVYDFRIVGKPE